MGRSCCRHMPRRSHVNPRQNTPHARSAQSSQGHLVTAVDVSTTVEDKFNAAEIASLDRRVEQARSVLPSRRGQMNHRLSERIAARRRSWLSTHHQPTLTQSNKSPVRGGHKLEAAFARSIMRRLSRCVCRAEHRWQVLLQKNTSREGTTGEGTNGCTINYNF